MAKVLTPAEVRGIGEKARRGNLLEWLAKAAKQTTNMEAWQTDNHYGRAWRHIYADIPDLIATVQAYEAVVEAAREAVGELEQGRPDNAGDHLKFHLAALDAQVTESSDDAT